VYINGMYLVGMTDVSDIYSVTTEIPLIDQEDSGMFIMETV
jgi:hypothetical protein